MKAVFLDVDGVLNNTLTRDIIGGRYRGLDEENLDFFKALIKASGAKIVLSSTWNETWEKEDKSKQNIFANYIDKRLSEIGLEIYDKTSDGMTCHRGDVILKYLDIHPEIDGYVVLDDSFFYDYLQPRIFDHFVQTQGNVGLTKYGVEKALSILMSLGQP